MIRSIQFGLAFMSLATVVGPAFGAKAAAAYEVGDSVVVIKKAELQVPGKTVASVDRGDLLQVENVNGKWLWVRRDGPPGWLDSRHVLSLDDGLKQFSDAIQKNPKEPNSFPSLLVSCLCVQ